MADLVFDTCGLNYPSGNCPTCWRQLRWHCHTSACRWMVCERCGRVFAAVRGLVVATQGKHFCPSLANPTWLYPNNDT